jgi:hypothetical protein
MSKRTWKDHLLSSGLPLEYSVARILERLSSWEPGEFRYERKDPEGVSRVFSIDVHSSHIDVKRNFWLETLVECKYRHDGTKWVFTPREYDPLFGQDLKGVFVTLDQCCADRQLNRDLVAEFRTHYPLCGKGVELLPDDTNRKTIEQAVQQLRHAVVAKALDAIVHQLDELLGSPTPLFVVVPIIVTTAELWRLRPGTTIEDVRKANEIQSIGDSHDLVVLHQEPDNIDKRQAVERFYETLGENQIKRFDGLLNATMKGSFQSFVDYFASYSLSLFVIIRYERFELAMKNLHRFFAQDTLVQERESG